MSDDDNDEPIESNKDALDEIGKQFDVTRERIKLIEEKALKKLRSNTEAKQHDLYCSFCRKSQHNVKSLITSETGVNICSECVQLCNDLLNEKDEQ